MNLNLFFENEGNWKGTYREDLDHRPNALLHSKNSTTINTDRRGWKMIEEMEEYKGDDEMRLCMSEEREKEGGNKAEDKRRRCC